MIQWSAATVALAGLVSGCAPGDGPAPGIASDSSPPPVAAAIEAPPGVAVANPRSVTVPGRGIAAGLDPLDVRRDGVLRPPDHGRAGWYAAGPEPGEPGAAVIAGHVDSDTGPDVFAELHRVNAGDRVLVHLHDGATLRFRVTSVGQYPQHRFPTQRVYATATQRPQLRLITCGGDYDHAAGRYLDNLVVFAVLTRG